MDIRSKALSRRVKAQELVRNLVPVLGLVLLLVIFQSISGSLFRIGNIKSIINQSYTIIIIALGGAFVYAHGGMDISYGGVIGVSMLCSTLVAIETNNPYLALVTCVACACVLSMVNAFFSIYLKVSPLIVSLCLMYMCRGVLNVVCSSEKFSVPSSMFPFDDWAVKIPVLLGVILVTTVIFEKTAIGKASKAIGGNMVAARQAGINVERTRFIGYLITGFCVGIAGFFQLCRAGSVSTSTGQGLEMNVITALVLGGISLSGGSGVRILRAVLGGLTVVVLRFGLNIIRLDENLIEGVQGIVLLLIVWMTYEKNRTNIYN
ncbi:MAG: ABC transporter permease [Eubacteriales bacterium]|nr:ABC transporter permease [Eubacteriales bacterium]